MSTPGDESRITPEMLVLEVLSACRQTEGVFRKYEGEAGGCLLCHSLFDSLAEAAAKYGLDLARLLADLKQAVREAGEGGT
jgi:hypothetical protein